MVVPRELEQFLRERGHVLFRPVKRLAPLRRVGVPGLGPLGVGTPGMPGVLPRAARDWLLIVPLDPAHQPVAQYRYGRLSAVVIRRGRWLTPAVQDSDRPDSVGRVLELRVAEKDPLDSEDVQLGQQFL